MRDCRVLELAIGASLFQGKGHRGGLLKYQDNAKTGQVIFVLVIRQWCFQCGDAITARLQITSSDQHTFVLRGASLMAISQQRIEVRALTEACVVDSCDVRCSPIFSFAVDWNGFQGGLWFGCGVKGADSGSPFVWSWQSAISKIEALLLQ